MGPLVLCILDGVGLRTEAHGNAFKAARTPHFDYLMENYPHTVLEASGPLVGLPKGQMGNSEVGHMNIGAGRIVYQPLEMINESVRTKEIFDNKEMISVMNHVKANNSKLHLCGLLSDGGIHSHIDHLFAIMELAKSEGIKEIYIHPFLDGRDTLPDVADTFIKQLEDKISELGSGVIATLAGRYYAMDRDNRWDRVEKAYFNMTQGSGIQKENAYQAILDSYKEGKNDEFIEPVVVNKNGLISNHDGIICFNYRPDRLRELFSALTNPEFKEFERPLLEDIKLVTLMPVSDEVICTNAYQLQSLSNTLGEYLSKMGKTQLRIAETEKYAHVTYFFDGGIERDLKGTKRILVPSPRVATYDLKPSMSAFEITEQLIDELKKTPYDVVVLNYANGDMVGHTGDFDATVEAVESVDTCLGELYKTIKELDGILFVVADHGNCDKMLDSEERIITSHSTSKVPLIITSKDIEVTEGKLADIAPTILTLLNLEIPEEMTGKNLSKR